MNSSLKSVLSLTLGVCLLYTSTASAQLFQRAKSADPQSYKTKVDKQVRRAVVAEDSQNKNSVAKPKAKVKTKSKPQPKRKPQSVKQVSYNTFDSTGIEGFHDGAGSLEPVPMEHSQGSISMDGCSSCPLGSGCDCCDESCCGDCCFDCLDCCGPPRSICDRPGQFFFIGEYIYARASFSEALAYVITDSNNPQDGAEFVEFDFDYESSYRFSGGYRLNDCGAEIVFNYSRYRSDARFEVEDGGANIQIFGPYEIEPRETGGILSGFADVDIDSYDLGITKTIPLGCPLGCCDSCCDTCCGSGCDDVCCGDSCCDDVCCGDSCGSCWCPAWDITWSAGVRFAEVDWNRSTFAFDDGENSPFEGSDTRLSFDGAGARVGILGRRYFGCSGWFSAYAKGDISLLVGDMDIRTTIRDFESSVLQNVVSHRNSGRRVIPVTELEAGVTAHLGKHVHLSSGYFISAWHDLGMRDEYDFVAGGGGFQLSHYDDANILGFDGLFARAEITY